MVQILNLAHNKSEIERRVHAVIDKFAERGLRSLGVAYQVENKEEKSFLLTGKLPVAFNCNSYRKFQMEEKRAQEGRGNSLVSCHFLIPQDMTVQKQFVGH